MFKKKKMMGGLLFFGTGSLTQVLFFIAGRDDSLDLFLLVLLSIFVPFV